MHANYQKEGVKRLGGRGHSGIFIIYKVPDDIWRYQTNVNDHDQANVGLAMSTL